MFVHIIFSVLAICFCNLHNILPESIFLNSLLYICTTYEILYQLITILIDLYMCYLTINALLVLTMYLLQALKYIFVTNFSIHHKVSSPLKFSVVY